MKSVDDLPALERQLIEAYGPVIGGRSLLRALGLASSATLQRQIRRGTLGVKTFLIPGRRGRYAKARDIAAWLYALGKLDHKIGTCSNRLEKET